MADRIDSRSLYVGNTTEMRLPRHDTPLSLPAEHPRDALLRDEALLEAVQTDGQSQPPMRWWVASSPAVVVGLGLRRRVRDVVDVQRCRRAGADILERRAGGGVVLVDRHMLCGAICLPTTSLSADVTESYRWLGDRLARQLRSLGVRDARRVEVDEARADVADLRARPDALARLLLTSCYGALSPHEVVAGHAKLIGLAQIRRRDTALFQFGILLGDQSRLADLLVTSDEAERLELRAELRRRTVGLDTLLGLTHRAASEVAAAVAGARPFER